MFFLLPVQFGCPAEVERGRWGSYFVVRERPVMVWCNGNSALV